jgi:hypothetical protein
MTTRREAGKGSGKAVSQMVEPTFSVWLDQTSRNLMFEVPSRWCSTLGIDIGNASLWQLWKEDQPVVPPLVDGEQYGLVPKELEVRVGPEPTKKGDIDFTSETRKHGKMVMVAVGIAGAQQRIKTPPEVTLSQLISRHTAVPALQAETTFTWGKITGRGTPGKLQEGDTVEIKTGN